MNSYSGASIEYALYDPLTVINNDGSTSPYLAQSVTSNAAFSQWTVSLRPNIKFDDGSPLTAAAVAQDFTQYFSQPTSADYGTFIDVKSVTATGPLTDVFTLLAPDAQLPTVLSQYFSYNPDIKQLYGANWQAHPDGTGPFELVQWSQGNQTILKKNPNYWRKDAQGRQLPYVNGLIFKPIASDSTRVATLQSGTIDGMLSEVPATLQQTQSQSGVNTVLASGNGGYGIFFNAMAQPTNDVRVRLALSEATNVPAIVAAVGGGQTFSQQRNQYYPPGSPWYSTAVAAAAPTLDLTKAKAELQGYIADPKRSDGKAVGSPVSVTLNYEPGNAEQLAVVQLAQQDWQAIGVKVALDTQDEATLVGNALKGNFQANFFEWGDELPYDLFHHNYLPRPANLTNFTLFNNTTIEQQIAVLQTATSTSAIQQAVQTIGLVLDATAPLIFMGTSPVGWAIHTSKVGGAVGYPWFGTLQWSTIYAK
jgi:peptide/nickel transport system substrate-binding protein